MMQLHAKTMVHPASFLVATQCFLAFQNSASAKTQTHYYSSLNKGSLQRNPTSARNLVQPLAQKSRIRFSARPTARNTLQYVKFLCSLFLYQQFGYFPHHYSILAANSRNSASILKVRITQLKNPTYIVPTRTASGLQNWRLYGHLSLSVLRHNLPDRHKSIKDILCNSTRCYR
jgi:hypothetical protein